MKKGDEIDPKGLIAEAYKMDGIEPDECRSIFLDWALSVPTGSDMPALIRVLMDRHAVDGHPMTDVLREGAEGAWTPKRRGGWRSRTRPDDAN